MGYLQDMRTINCNGYAMAGEGDRNGNPFLPESIIPGLIRLDSTALLNMNRITGFERADDF